MKTTKGFQLSINMLVVIIIGLILLGAGVSMFFNAYNQTVKMRENIDSQKQQELTQLLVSEGARVMIPYPTKETKRGSFIDFDLAIANELTKEETFHICYEYSGSTAFNEENDPFLSGNAGNDWFLIPQEEITMPADEQEFIPIRIVVPKDDVAKGQYVFTLKVVIEPETEDVLSHENVCADIFQPDPYVTQYATTQKLYVVVN